MAIEEPPFTIEARAAHYQTRRYGKTLVAETTIGASEAGFADAGNRAFRILADYIFGNNRTKVKIAMTAPVTQQGPSEQIASEQIAMTAPVTQVKGADGFVVQFTMPSGYTLATLPEPNDARVHLRELPARRVAVYAYSGSWSESKYNEKLADFLSWLRKDGLRHTGAPLFARFNSPFQLWFLRRNEIWLELVDETQKPAAESAAQGGATPIH